MPHFVRCGLFTIPICVAISDDNFNFSLRFRSLISLVDSNFVFLVSGSELRSEPKFWVSSIVFSLRVISPRETIASTLPRDLRTVFWSSSDTVGLIGRPWIPNFAHAVALF